MLWTTALALAAETGCEDTMTLQDVSGLVANAERAFASLDREGFSAAHDRLLRVECINEPLNTVASAGIFRVRALQSHLQRSADDIKQNTAAMAEIDPLPPSSDITPKGHPVRNAWELARDGAPSPTEPLPVPLGGRIRIDGRDTLELALKRPSLVQFVEDGGVVGWTRINQPGGRQGLPRYDLAPEGMRDAYDNALLVERPRKPIGLPILAGVLLAGAAGTWGASFAANKSFWANTDSDRIQSQRRLVNGLNVTAAGLGIAGAGVGAWAVAAW